MAKDRGPKIRSSAGVFRIHSSHASTPPDIEEGKSIADTLKREWRRFGQGMSLREYARTLAGEVGVTWLANKAA